MFCTNLVCLVRHLWQWLCLGLLMFLVTVGPLLRPTARGVVQGHGCCSLMVVLAECYVAGLNV